MVVAIIIFIVVIIGWFLIDRNRMIVKLKNEGGIRSKYRELIDLMLAGHPNNKIFREDSTSLDLGVSSFGTSTTFTLLMAFKTITISYHVRSEIFGNHSLKWDFGANDNQEFMFRYISKDIEKYFENNISKIEDSQMKYIKKMNDKLEL